MGSLGSLFTGACMLFRPMYPKEDIRNGTRMPCRVVIVQQKPIIVPSLVTLLITNWPISLKPNYSIPMNGRNYLSNQVRNILCLLPNITMVSLYGPVKMPTAPGGFPGMRWMWDL